MHITDENNAVANSPTLPPPTFKKKHETTKEELKIKFSGKCDVILAMSEHNNNNLSE